MAGPINRGVNNTPYSPNADKVAQISGSGQPVPGTVKPAYVSGGNTVLDTILQYSNYAQIVTASGNSTLTTGTVFNPGGRLAVQINNDASADRTITFGTGFKSTGTVIGNSSKITMVDFVSDGTTYNEISRAGPY